MGKFNDFSALIRAACRGGWPASLQLTERAATMIANDYVNTVCEQESLKLKI